VPVILIVEDDRDIAQLIAHYVERAGHVPVVASNGTDALELARERAPDVVVLDLMLPGMDGLEVCRAIRADRQLREAAIIMLTARAEEADRVTGLETGADDYVAKPFSPKELVARINAQLRRRQRLEPAHVVTYGDVVIDVDRHTVTDAGQEVHLTAKEFLLLRYLLEHRGRVLSRDLLLTDVWGYQYTGGTRTVDVHIRRLREKLPVLADAIVTVKQFGYRLAETPGVLQQE
jgi:DNA-binding response OmpR family regulator